ncbi:MULTISPECIES: DUF2339 domain-containing protein [Natrialbaceae]|uniref:DUF2339 domain-containing protein n=1 Tax=Natrialbaceae TaxID=1644061 RepID=UPI00207CB81D|nr:DUF2339 domain-containing protein [Natronococcus sp. CG52]
MSDDDDLAAEVRQLRSEVEALQDRVATLEEATETGPAAETPRSDNERSRVDSDTAPSSEEAVAPSADRESVRTRDWERDLGVKWLGLIGGLALVVGVVFFVRLTIEAGLLGPRGRVMVGTVGGLALAGGGRFAAERQGYVRWGRIAAGIGLAIAYFSLYAAYGFEAYRTAIGTPLWIVLLALTVLVAGTAILSVRDRAPVVAGEAFLLGYVTAYLGLDTGTFVVTPAYALLLAAGLVVIARVRPWSRLVATSVLPTYGVIWAWIVDLDPTAPLVAGVVVAAFGIYLVGGYELRASELDDRWHRLQVRSCTVLNAGTAALLFELTAREWFPDISIEGVAVGTVGLALIGVYAFTARRPVQRDETAGTLAAVLVASSVVIAAGTFTATVGLLAVVCSAVAIASLVDAEAFRTGAHIVAVGTVLKILIVDARVLPAVDPADPLTVATGRATAFALGIVVFYGLAWWFRKERITPSGTEKELTLATPYAWAGTGLTIVVLGLELSDAGVSVAWAVFGLVLVGVGLVTDGRDLRLQGVAAFGLVTAKVFLYDTRDLDMLARTLSFLVLGGILLVASYAYARWQGEDPLHRLTRD